MRGYNRCIFIGYSGRAPQMFRTDKGLAIAHCSLASNDRYKSGDYWKEETTWVRLVAFGRRAEVFEKHVVKGSLLLVECRAKNSKWTDKNGTEREQIEFVVDDVKLLGTTHDAKAEAPTSVDPPVAEEPYDPDVPF